MFFILHALFFIIYRFYSNFVEIWTPRSNFALKSAYKKLTKNKKNFRPTDPNIFRHVSGNMGIFLGLILKNTNIAYFFARSSIILIYKA